MKVIYREPHSLSELLHIPNFTDKTIAFVGKKSWIEEALMFTQTAVKYEASITRFLECTDKMPKGTVLEISGIVNSSCTSPFV